MKAILLGSLEALTDTSRLWRMAFRHALRDHGISFDASPSSILLGVRPDFDEVTAPLGPLMRARDAHFIRALAKGPLIPRTGLTNLIRAAQHAGMPLALVGAQPLEWTVSAFSSLPIPPETFDMIVNATDVAAPKPAPDCYHLAAAMLATAPEDCVAVEDSRDGLSAAAAAGIPTIDLNNPREDGRNCLAALAERIRETATTAHL